MMSHQQKTLDAGFTVVADPSTGVAHKVDGPCWEEKHFYTPFASMEQAEQHDNIPCTKCAGMNTGSKTGKT